MATLAPTTISTLRADLPTTASRCVEAIIREVPEYDRAFDEAFTEAVENAVVLALAAFCDIEEGKDGFASPAMREGAYRLGHGEAQSGRSVDALLAAYRVGTRVAWKAFATVALASGEDSEVIASLAERTFEFIDELSALSIAGHTDSSTARTRDLDHKRDQLSAALASGESRHALERLAEAARWKPVETLTALILEGDPPSALGPLIGERSLWAPGSGRWRAVFLPSLAPGMRQRALEACGPTPAALGPTVPWYEVSESLVRAYRCRDLAPHRDHVDAEAMLPELALTTDKLVGEALKDRALAPMADLPEAKQELLAETLLTWLLHQGRREEVAAVLHVHPQTVRYRMNQIRELYGDLLTDDRSVLEIVFGLMSARAAASREARA